MTKLWLVIVAAHRLVWSEPVPAGLYASLRECQAQIQQNVNDAINRGGVTIVDPIQCTDRSPRR